MLYRLGKKSKKIVREKRAEDEVGGEGGGGGLGVVATKGKECHHQHFAKLHPTVEDSSKPCIF